MNYQNEVLGLTVINITFSKQTTLEMFKIFIRIKQALILLLMLEFTKITQQQKIQRALEIKKRILKQTHIEELAKTFNLLTTKSEELNKTTNIIDPTFLTFQKKLPECVMISNSLIQTSASMSKSKHSFKAVRNPESTLSWKGVIIQRLGNK